MKTSQERNPTLRPSGIEHVIAAIATLLMIEQHSRLPEANFFIVILCGAITLGLVVVYFARLVKRGLGGASPAGAKHRGVLSWLVLPVAITLMLSSAATHWPATIRFYLSKPSFDALVEQAYSGEKPHAFPRWVGLYWIDHVVDDDFNYDTCQGTIGFVTGVALIDECGISYDKKNPECSHSLTTRIAPCWYLTEW